MNVTRWLVRLTLATALLGAAAAPAFADDVDKLAQNLHDGSSDFRVRVGAALALGKTKNEGARPHLEQALASDSQPAVRGAAAAGLGALGDARAIPALEKAASGDDSPDVRATADSALKKLKKKPAKSNVKVLVELGPMKNHTNVRGAELEGAFKGATRTEMEKIGAVEVLDDGADGQAEGTKRKLPVLIVEGDLKELVPENDGSVHARVRYMVKRESAIKGTLDAKGSVSDGAASTVDGARLRGLQDEAILAAVESAMKNAPKLLFASAK